MDARGETDAAPAVRVVVDDRERAAGLARAVSELWSPTFEGRLPAGDVQVGPRVLVERKSVADLAASLADGRLFRQAHALMRAAARPLLIVEGEDGFDVLGIDPAALRGVLLTLLVGYRIPILRTGSVAETAVNVAALARQETRRLAQARARGRPGSAGTRGRAVLDVLGGIPGVGDERARRLIEACGSLEGVASAGVEDLMTVSGIGPTVAREVRRVLGDREVKDP